MDQALIVQARANSLAAQAGIRSRQLYAEDQARALGGFLFVGASQKRLNERDMMRQEAVEYLEDWKGDV